MLKCIYDQYQWPECDKTCGLVPSGDYVAGSCAEERLIVHFQNEIIKLLATTDTIKLHLYRARRSYGELNEIEKLLPSPEDYIPTCSYGYDDCIYDPAYIRKYYPDRWIKLGMPTSCENRLNGEKYDDEDK